MKRFAALLTAIALSSLVAGSAHAADVADGRVTPDPLPLRIRFIGNSHTGRNGGLDWHIENLAASDPRSSRAVVASSETTSGATLMYHYENGATSRIRVGRYDVVVLQGHLPGSHTFTAAPFLEYSRRFDEVIDETGARTVFFMSWPQRRLEWAGLDDIVAAHRQVESELDADIAPVAVAMERARAERPDLDLIGEDDVHATWAGAYLSAVVVYATLFDRSPEGLPYHFGVSEADAAFLQRIAWETILEWRAGSPEG